MDLPNREGRPVDPWPFVVVAGVGLLCVYSFGPLYLMALGASVTQALAVCTAVAAGVVAAAFHRYVWTVQPALRGEVPATERFRRLVYGALLLAAVLALLSLPLLARG